MPTKETMRKRAYDADHSRRYQIKLNRTTDADIIEKLDSVPSMQGYIKTLIRADIKEQEHKQ